jgi:hypothetical protein
MGYNASQVRPRQVEETKLGVGKDLEVELGRQGGGAASVGRGCYCWGRGGITVILQRSTEYLLTVHGFLLVLEVLREGDRVESVDVGV